MAEAAADVRGDHADLVRGQAQEVADELADLVDLRRGPDRQLVAGDARWRWPRVSMG
jgi:hypothetical protein